MSSVATPHRSGHVPLHRQLIPLMLVAVGGAVGALSRYGISTAWSHHGTFAWPVLLINCLGALVLGALLEALTGLGPDEGVRQKLRLLVGTGFCGAFTTYSTFAHDVVSLGHHDAVKAWSWGAFEVVLGFCFAALGAWCGSRFAASRSQDAS